MVTSVWLGLGLVLATMTRLRFDDVPVGPGEILLVGYILAVLPTGLLKLYGSKAAGGFYPTGVRLLGWYVALCLLLVVGCWLGNRTGTNPYGSAKRDMLAYAFCFLVVISIVLGHDGTQAKRTLRAILWICAAASAATWVLALGFGTFGSLNPWYGGYGVRFAGLGLNPNQNALLLVGLPFLLLFALRNPGLSRRARIIGVCVGALAVAAGWSTGSAALRLVWLILVPLAVPVALVVRRESRLLQAERNWLAALLLGALVIYLSSSTILTTMLNFVLSVLPSSVGGIFIGQGTAHADLILLSGGAEWTDRFSLWKNAWLVIQDSILFGHGPGPLSGMIAPYGGSEAHNSLIDWTMASGLLGGGVLVALACSIAWRSLSVKYSDLFFVLLAIAMFSMAHQVLRHPLVWATLTLVAIVVSRRQMPKPEAAVEMKKIKQA